MSAVVSPDDDTRATLLAVEQRRQQALMNADLATLDDLYDESLIHIHAPGLVHTKVQLMQHVGLRQAYLDIRRGELTIRLIGDVAIMTGTLTNRLARPDGGERTMGGVVTQVLRRCEDGQWRFVSFQMTPHDEYEWPALPSEMAAQDQIAPGEKDQKP